MYSKPILMEPIRQTCNKTEHNKNVERGTAWIRAGLKPYSGEFPELDLEATWHCPECRELDRPLKLSSDKLTLLCVNPAYVCMEGTCEYEYSNAEGREKSQTFWSSGYSLPVTTNDLLNERIQGNLRAIALIEEQIKNAPADIAKLEQKISALQAQLK